MLARPHALETSGEEESLRHWRDLIVLHALHVLVLHVFHVLHILVLHSLYIAVLHAFHVVHAFHSLHTLHVVPTVARFFARPVARHARARFNVSLAGYYFIVKYVRQYRTAGRTLR